MRIRAAREQEIEALCAIAHRAKAGWGYSPAVLEAWRDELTPTADSVRANPTYVAEIAGDAASGATLEIAGFYQVAFDAVDPARAELEHLWVHPALWRRGIGRALLAHAVQTLREARVTILEIDSDPNAVAFYRACGAVRIGVKAAPFDGETDRVRPQLRLTIR